MTEPKINPERLAQMREAEPRPTTAAGRDAEREWHALIDAQANGWRLNVADDKAEASALLAKVEAEARAERSRHPALAECVEALQASVANTDRAIAALAAEKERLLHVEQRARLLDLSEAAWGIIANAGGGNWDKESAAWEEAAIRWRDRYHALLAETAEP